MGLCAIVVLQFLHYTADGHLSAVPYASGGGDQCFHQIAYAVLWAPPPAQPQHSNGPQLPIRQSVHNRFHREPAGFISVICRECQHKLYTRTLQHEFGDATCSAKLKIHSLTAFQRHTQTQAAGSTFEWVALNRSRRVKQRDSGGCRRRSIGIAS